MTEQDNGELFGPGASHGSPVTRIIALRYYDGPTDGVLQCGANGPVFRFELRAWDDDQDLRVFALSPLTSDAFDRLSKVLEKREAARWPVWAPIRHDETTNLVHEIVNEAGPVEWVIAAEDLSKEIVTAKRVSPDVMVGDIAWSEFLGLATPLQATVRN